MKSRRSSPLIRSGSITTYQRIALYNRRSRLKPLTREVLLYMDLPRHTFGHGTSNVPAY